MKKAFLEKANDLYSQVVYWQSRVDDFKEVVEHPNRYNIGFNGEHNTIWLETDMNNNLNVLFAKKCLTYAEKKLAEAQKFFAEL